MDTDLPLALFGSDGGLPCPDLRAHKHKVVAGLHPGLPDSVLLNFAWVTVARLTIRVKNDHSLKQEKVLIFHIVIKSALYKDMFIGQ